MLDTSQLEYAIVGAICIEPKICDKISTILSPDDFSISACSEVYEAACDALSRGKHFDAVLAADAIRNRVDDAVNFIRENRGSSWRCKKRWRGRTQRRRSRVSARTSYRRTLAAAYRASGRP